MTRLNVDVLVVDGSPSATAAKTVATTIPIVFTLVSDPVGSGFVAASADPWEHDGAGLS